MEARSTRLDMVRRRWSEAKMDRGQQVMFGP